MLIKQGKFLLICWAVSLGVAGCQPSAPAPGQGLRVGLESNPTNLDPRLATDVASARVTQVVFNSLVGKDIHSKLLPELALKWEVSGDTTYVFYLRRGVKFQDGSKLTAHDVEYTFSSILDKKFKSPRRSSYEQIKQIVVVDDYTIKFVLKKPFAPFLLNMTMGIVPRHLAEQPDFSRRPLGSGPFRLLRWKPDEGLVFERHEDYFEGLPHLKRLAT